ncbi:MAG: alpha-ketoacid dehydrogenase subunit beta, partial [Actinomycetota bacterium]
MEELTYGEALNRALAEEMARDESIYIIGEDIGEHGGAFGVTMGLIEKYGKKRVVETPIAEEGYIG